MNKHRVLFVDRDGTLIEEPADEQVDSLDKIRFMPGAFAALNQLKAAGYRLVIVTNQDGLGTDSFPQAKFDQAQRFVLDAFSSQGVEFGKEGVYGFPTVGRFYSLRARGMLVRTEVSGTFQEHRLNQTAGIGGRE